MSIAAATGNGSCSDAPRSRLRRWPRTLGIAALVVAVLLLTTPLVWPIAPLADTVSPAQLAGPGGRFVTVDDLDVYHEISGPSDADCNIVLLHGFGASVYSWRDTLPDLAARCRVVAFDRPGFGLTSHPMPGEWTGNNPYAVETQADLTIALMDELGMERAVLVGHSAGAAVAVLAADRYPDRISALVLEAPAVFEAGRVPRWAGPLLRSPQLRRIGPAFVRDIAGDGSDSLIRDSYHDQSLVTEEILAGYRVPLSAQNWDRALWEYVAAPRPRDLPEVVSSLTLPVLVITPAGDRLVDPKAQRETADLIPGSRLEVIEDAGHLLHEEYPTVFESLIFRFIDELQAAGIP
ncbi:MAG: alpha/beta hydrolase [Actinomycetota bacterium]|nr:alpha/beta hydrolase [Actinomycetota bacterium]